VYDKKNPKDHY